MTTPRRILVLSADENQRLEFEEWLGEAGFEVALAGDCEDAFTQATSGALDLIVVDLATAVDGVDLIKRVRDRPELINVLMLAIAEWGSGYGTLALSQDVDAFEPAPIDAARLVASVARLLGNHMGVTQ